MSGRSRRWRFTTHLLEKEFEQISSGERTGTPKNKVIITREDITALRQYLERKERLETQVFPKIRV